MSLYLIDNQLFKYGLSERQRNHILAMVRMFAIEHVAVANQIPAGEQELRRVLAKKDLEQYEADSVR